MTDQFKYKIINNDNYLNGLFQKKNVEDKNGKFQGVEYKLF